MHVCRVLAAVGIRIDTRTRLTVSRSAQGDEHRVIATGHSLHHARQSPSGLGALQQLRQLGGVRDDFARSVHGHPATAEALDEFSPHDTDGIARDDRLAFESAGHTADSENAAVSPRRSP